MQRPRQVAGLDLQETEDGFIVYQPEEDRVHYLNPTAVLILQLCDGQNTVAEIAGLVQQAYPEGSAVTPESVPETIQKLAEAGLVR